MIVIYHVKNSFNKEFIHFEKYEDDCVFYGDLDGQKFIAVEYFFLLYIKRNSFWFVRYRKKKIFLHNCNQIG